MGGERSRDFEMRQKIQERMCEEPCEPRACSIILNTIGAMSFEHEYRVVGTICIVEVFWLLCGELVGASESQ